MGGNATKFFEEVHTSTSISFPKEQHAAMQALSNHSPDDQKCFLHKAAEKVQRWPLNSNAQAVHYSLVSTWAVNHVQL